jgi:hypothetical protein
MEEWKSDLRIGRWGKIFVPKLKIDKSLPMHGVSGACERSSVEAAMSDTMQTVLQVMIALWFVAILIWPDFLEDDVDLEANDSDQRPGR